VRATNFIVALVAQPAALAANQAVAQTARTMRSRLVAGFADSQTVALGRRSGPVAGIHGMQERDKLFRPPSPRLNANIAEGLLSQRRVGMPVGQGRRQLRLAGLHVGCDQFLGVFAGQVVTAPPVHLYMWLVQPSNSLRRATTAVRSMK